MVGRKLRVAILISGRGSNMTALIDAARALIDMPEDSLEQIAAKRNAFERLHTGSSWFNLKTACDCYIAAFFVPKDGNVPRPADLAKPSIPLTDHVWAAARGQMIYSPLVGISDKVAFDANAFHWPIEFPHIFSRGGFDAVIGNPPWERMKLQEREFFSLPAPEIATATNAAKRRQLVAKLESDEPALYDRYRQLSRPPAPR